MGSGGGDAGCEQERQLGQLATVLEAGLDWELVGEIAGGPGSCCSSTQLDRVAEAAALPAARDRKAAGASKGAGTAAAATAAPASSPAAALAALDRQAQHLLQAWQAALPSGTATCSISVLPTAGGGTGSGCLLISRLAPADEKAAGTPAEGGSAAPPLLVCLPVPPLSASLSQHPIRALQLDNGDDGGDSGDSGDARGSASEGDRCVHQAAALSALKTTAMFAYVWGACCRCHRCSVRGVLHEMHAVLEASGRSMRELATDTQEQQREWWRAR